MKLKKNYIKKQLSVVELKNTIPLFLDKEIIDKIQYLCTSIPQVEWSGVLLYRVEGSIKEPESMKLYATDIIPMDKGSHTYTEYKYNDDGEDFMIDYFEEYPDKLESDWKVGHIHSHNSMSVFFSGTDMSELNDNSASHNFYLSLIVNNVLDFQAKIAFRGEMEKESVEPYFALDENGVKYNISQDTVKYTDTKLFVIDCDIHIPSKIELTLDRFFTNKVAEIITNSEKKSSIKTWSYPSKNYGKPRHPGYNTGTNPIQSNNDYQRNFPYYGTSNNNNAHFEEEETEALHLMQDYIIGDEFETQTQDDIDEFLLYLFTSQIGSYAKSLEACFIDMKKKPYLLSKTLKGITNNFVSEYKDFFLYNTPLVNRNHNKEAKNFQGIMEIVIEDLELYTDQYKFLNKLVRNLKKLKYE